MSDNEPTPQAPALAACPFCGSAEIDAEGWESNDGTKGPVCDGCGACAASAAAWNRRASTGGTAQAPAPAECGHPASLLLKSAETGEPLYCEACDDKSGRRDAEKMEAELHAEAVTWRKAVQEARDCLRSFLDMDSTLAQQGGAYSALETLVADAWRASQAPATDCDECDALRMNLADLLTRTANALRGQPAPGRLWSWHDVPERAAAAIAAIGVMQRCAASLAAESEGFRQAVLDPENQPSQYGTVLLAQAPAADERALIEGLVLLVPQNERGAARIIADRLLASRSGTVQAAPTPEMPKSMVRRIATQMGWTPPRNHVDPAEPHMEPAAFSTADQRSLSAVDAELLRALQALEPYLDAIVCYASTQGEHEPNRIAAQARAAIRKATE